MSWRDGLTAAQQAKVGRELQAWLDGADVSRFDLISDAPDTLEIWARVAVELPAARVPEFVVLGLRAEDDMLAIPGTVTREQLVTLLRHPDIVGASPMDRMRFTARRGRRASITDPVPEATQAPAPSATQRPPTDSED